MTRVGRIHRRRIGMLAPVPAVCLSILLFTGVAGAQSEDSSPAIELQSRLMSFADRLIARVSEATHQYLFEGTDKSAQARMAVTNGRLNASAAAVGIAAGRNPEVALLDMIVLVKLFAFTVEDSWMPKVLGPEAGVFLETFRQLENELWSIADGALSAQQKDELNALAAEWRKNNKGRLSSVAGVRFSEFAGARHDSTLFEKGKPGGFLKKVGEATREIERTRLLAERAIFLAERQAQLIGWRAEQVFYNLAVTSEFESLITGISAIPVSAGDVARDAGRVSDVLEEIHAVIDLDSADRRARTVDNLRAVLMPVAGEMFNVLLLRIFLWALVTALMLVGVILLYRFLAPKIDKMTRT